MKAADSQNWIDFSRDSETGIELFRTHFVGNSQAYDPHWHDDYLIGYTEQGVQQFSCRRQVQRSTPGNIFLIEPGELHDGEAPQQDGFTYRALYLPTDWLHRQLADIFEDLPDRFELRVEQTLCDDRRLMASLASAYMALKEGEPRMVRDACVDQLMERMTAHFSWRKRQRDELLLPGLARQGRDFLHAHLHQDIGLDDLAQTLDTDRFKINRAFKAAFGVAPHTYLLQLRLIKARELLARGRRPAEVAADLCFSDQSHLGRWFRRAYKLTPAAYRSLCTGVPDGVG